ncbi:MAG: efflux RND transporter periplasmic adaptor subunit [Bryobacterales bacterium]|nr:efflux RND transporter periplasmic adaptor subunit [Bryobacterales bacterium]
MPNYTNPAETTPAETTEEQLRKQVEDLKRQLKEQKRTDAADAALPSNRWRPSRLTIAAIFLAAAVLMVIAFLAGYIPLQKREALVQAETAEQDEALPRVEVIQVGRVPGQNQLELPGSIQAVTEAPILARADGYLSKRLVDIGDRVRTGQPLAEIDAPELDQQLLQAKAALQQAQASLEQALANHEQGQANLQLARVTAQRWKQLAAAGVVSQQDNDQYQAQLTAQTANVQALEKAIAAQRSNVAAAEANIARLNDVLSYRVVKAPFDGVITVRNVDTGALVVSGTTLIYRIAQTGMLRTYVNVPQANAGAVHTGQAASLSVSTFPGRRFPGKVARTASALDASTRTMLVEVEVPNAGGSLLPGMYAQVDLNSTTANAPLVIPAEALIFRAEGTRVAMVRPDHTIHLQTVVIGRDYGDKLEITQGLRSGDTIVANPGDATREGVKVEPVAQENKAE